MQRYMNFQLFKKDISTEPKEDDKINPSERIFYQVKLSGCKDTAQKLTEQHEMTQKQFQKEAQA